MSDGKKVIIFISVFASDWSRLEGIYKATAADSENAVYVMPVPYYDKDPEGNRTAEHYESELLPGDLAFMDHNRFITDKIKADMIYFQYPFDNTDYTTGIPEEFYTENLKALTDKLIYVSPYEVTPVSADDERGLNTEEYFVNVPGVLGADIVVVGDESVKSSYIDYLTAKGSEGRDYWEERIISRADPRLSEYYFGSENRTLSCDNANSKKKILYYISASTFFEYGKDAVSKLRRVMDVFFENREDIGVVWQIDPVMEQVFKEDEPELYDEYEQIRLEYSKKSDLEFVNDISSVTQTCSAFYGDPGLSATYFIRAGLPVMIQDISI